MIQKKKEKRKQALKAYHKRYKRYEEKRDKNNVNIFLKFNQKDGRIQCQIQINTKETDSGILNKEIKTQQPLRCIYKINGKGEQQQKQQKPGKRKYIYEEDDDDNADEDYKRKRLDAIKSFEYRRKEHTLRNTPNTFRVLVVFDATNTYVPSNNRTSVNASNNRTNI